ncbi:MAG: AAA family ATPase, partial [Actinomycetota bacterium]|nr:AAA family ATPase [Actinomycetota bacterium]
LRLIDRAVDEALGGTGRLALLEGEAGIGKSRLAVETAGRAAPRGMALLWGACYEGGGAPAFWPWTHVLRSAVDLLNDTERAALPPDLTQLVPELGGGQPVPAPPDAESRFRLYDHVVAVLTSLAARRPLLVVLDDLHWADLPSLQLLQALALDLVRARILVLATYRPDEPDAEPELAHALAAVGRHPWTRRVRLEGLDRDGVEQVIRDAAGIEPARNLVSAVHARTEGNPFFVAELIRLLASETDLSADRVLYTGIPLGVRDVVRRRLLAVPAETRQLLELAAVVGRDFEFDLLVRAAHADRPGTLRLLEPALALGLVESGAELASYRFSHALVRETIVEDLAAPRRARLHHAVADAIVALHADHDDYAELLAEHLWRASELAPPERVLPVVERGAAVALVRRGFESAETLLERALMLAARLRPGPARDAKDLALGLQLASVRMITRAWSAPEVIEGFRKVEELARRSGRSPEAVQSLHGLASGLYVSGHFQDGLDVSRRALSIAQESGDDLSLAVAHHGVGIGELHLGRIGAARAQFAACIDAADRLERTGATAFETAVPPNMIGPAFGSLAEYLGGDPERADALRTRLGEIALGLDTAFAHQIALVFSAWLAALEDDPAACRRYVEEGQRHVGDAVFPVFGAVGPLLLAWAEGRQGDASAVDRIDLALAQLRELNSQTLEHMFLGLRADVLAANGATDAAIAAYGDALAVSERSGEAFFRAELLRRRGLLLARTGEDGSDDVRSAAELAARQEAWELERRARESLAAVAA